MADRHAQREGFEDEDAYQACALAAGTPHVTEEYKWKHAAKSTQTHTRNADAVVPDTPKAKNQSVDYEQASSSVKATAAKSKAAPPIGNLKTPTKEMELDAA